MRPELALGQQDERELVAGQPGKRILRLEQPSEPAREREQKQVADRDADQIVDLLETVEVDHHDGRADRRIGPGEGERRIEPIDEQLAVGKPREVVVNRVVQEPFLRGLEFGHVGQRADEPDDLAVGADDRPRLEREPEVMPVRRAQAEILGQPAAPLFQDGIERCAESIPVERMQDVEPARRRSFERPALQSEQGLGLRAGEDLVGGDVPVPDHVAGAGERQRAALDVGDDAVGDAAGKGVLHHREPDQHDDEHESAEQRRADDVVGHRADDGEAGGERPDQQQQPGRNEQHRAIEALGREIDHERKAERRNEEERNPRDAGGDRRIEQRERHQRAEPGEPGDGDMGIAHVPAIEVEVGEQEHEQRGGQDRFTARTPDPLGARRHVEHLAPEAEVDPDIDQHRPAERGRGREHDAALHHEQDGEKEREQSGDADDDAMIERETVDLVLVGVGFPQIELRQPVGAQLGDEGDDGAGVERDAENVRRRTVLTFGAVARARRDGDDAREPEIRPEQAGTDHPVMGRHDQPIDLLVARIGQRENRPSGTALAGGNLDAAHDAVGAGCGRYLEAIAVGALPLDCLGEIDRRRVDLHIDGIDGVRAGCADHERDQNGRNAGRVESDPSETLRAPGFRERVWMSSRGLWREQGFPLRVKGSARSCRYACWPPCAHGPWPLARAERSSRSPV